MRHLEGQIAPLEVGVEPKDKGHPKGCPLDAVALEGLCPFSLLL